jgi:hypothetical protein
MSGLAEFVVDDGPLTSGDKIAGHCRSHYLVEFLCVELLPPVMRTG